MIGESEGIDLPQGVEELYNETVFQEQHYTRPDARPQRSGVGGLSHAQSFGAAPEDLRKGLLLQYLRRIAGIVEPVLKRDPAPLILAAQPEIQGNFREMASWKELLPEGLQDNPDAMSDDQLREKAWALLDPARDKSRGDAIGRLNGLIGTGKARHDAGGDRQGGARGPCRAAVPAARKAGLGPADRGRGPSRGPYRRA